MAESEGNQATVNQAAIQAVTAVMMVLRYTGMRPRTATKAKTWQTITLKSLQLECPGQVHRITSLQNGSQKHS